MLPQNRAVFLYAFCLASHSSMIFTPLEEPSLVAPASIIFTASSYVLIPPLALTPTASPTVLRIRATSSTVAPPPEKPVDVFTKPTPMFLAFACFDLFLICQQACLNDDF